VDATRTRQLFACSRWRDMALARATLLELERAPDRRDLVAAFEHALAQARRP
jgi:hypothetical protein